MLFILFALNLLSFLNIFCVASNFVQLADHSWIDIGWGRAWSGHLCFLMDWLLISAKHDLDVLQKPAIANIVYLDIPKERLTALEPRSWAPSLKRESSVMMSSVIPSERHSGSGSPLMLVKGSTASVYGLLGFVRSHASDCDWP